MIAEMEEVHVPGAGDCREVTMSRAVLVLDKTVVKAKLQGGEPDDTCFIELTRAPFDCEMQTNLWLHVPIMKPRERIHLRHGLITTLIRAILSMV